MWSESDKNFISENYTRLTPEQMTSVLGRTEAAIRAYMYRHGLATKQKVKCPIIEKLINIKFADVTWFRPNRAFYDQVKISQKRFTDLRMGYSQPTEDEIKRIANALHINRDDFIELFHQRQLNLFDD